MDNIHFPRTAAAHDIAKQSLGKIFLAPTTIFLSAPRRTGKTRFILRDVIPEIEALGGCVIYIDLWKDREADPARLISFAIAKKLSDSQGAIRRAADAVGLEKVSIHGVEFSLKDVGSAPGASVSDALAELHKLVKKPIVLIVDEAQHVISSKDALNIMFALKSARDTLNGGKNGVVLGLIMSGSDRDKLLRLTNGNAAPFMGSAVSIMPVLDRDFTDFIAGHLAVNSPELAIDNAHLYEAFERFDHKPEFFLSAIRESTGAFAGSPSKFLDRLDAAAAQYQQQTRAKYSEIFGNLSPIQQGILTRILSADGGGQERLFSQEALSQYGRLNGGKKPISPGTAREALNKLREMEPPVVWRSAHGEYSPEDSGMTHWYTELVHKGEWPPK